MLSCEDDSDVSKKNTYLIHEMTSAGAWRANNGTRNDFGTAVPFASIKTLDSFNS